MTAIGVLAIAFSNTGERYDSFHTPPEVKEYIESVSPDSVPHKYVDNGKFFQIDTTKLGCQVTAASQVVLPGGDSRSFSYWLLRPDPHGQTQKATNRTLDIFHGEYGIIGLYYGVRRIPIHWQGFDEKAFDRFVHIMMSHAPSWEPYDPQPWERIGRKE